MTVDSVTGKFKCRDGHLAVAGPIAAESEEAYIAHPL